MSIPKEIVDNTPTLIFSPKERYLPCDLFFSGKQIENNRRIYDGFNETQKKDEKWCWCYYRFSEGPKFKVCQYWYYYAYNPYTLDNHIHDLESVKLFINKNSEKREYIIFNFHGFHKTATLKDGKMPVFKVELGSHAMWPILKGLNFPFWWHDKDKTGKTFLIPASKDLEDLRIDVLKRPEEFMDKDFKLIGKDFSGAGKGYAPVLPWVRWEYYLPEELLDASIKEEKNNWRLEPPEPKLEPRFSGSDLRARTRGGQTRAIPKRRHQVSLNRVKSRKKALKKKQVPIKAAIPIPEYSDLFEKIGIVTTAKLTRAKPDSIHDQMEKYIKKHALDLDVPTTEDLAKLQTEIKLMLTEAGYKEG